MRCALAFALAASACAGLTAPVQAQQSPSTIVVTLTLNGAVVAPGGDSAGLTDDELRALGSSLMNCWVIPATVLGDIGTQFVEVKATLNEYRTIVDPLSVVRSSSNDKVGGSFRDSALASLRSCRISSLPAAKFDRWKEITVRFSPLGKLPDSASAPSVGAAAAVAPATAAKPPREVYVRSPTARNVPELTVSEIGEKLTACWNPKSEASVNALPTVTMQFELRRDGNVAKDPIVAEHASGASKPGGPLATQAIDRAKKAIYRCAPFAFLPKALHPQWRTVIADF